MRVLAQSNIKWGIFWSFVVLVPRKRSRMNSEPYSNSSGFALRSHGTNEPDKFQHSLPYEFEAK
jgi:hypothetical protein